MPPSEPARRAPKLPPAGWMPDPSRMDIERYWDGLRWTARTRDAVSKLERVPMTAHASEGPMRSAGSGSAGSGSAGGRSRGASRRRRRARRRPSLAPWLATVVALALIALSGYMGMLPSWTAWPQAWTRQTPSGPDVGYPVFGSDELTTYLARNMIAQKGTIDVSFVEGGGSSDLLSDAMSEALTQNPYVFVTGWAVTDAGGLTTIAPEYTYNSTEAERRRVATSSAVDALVTASGAASAGSDAEAVTLLHDAIAQGARYDWDAYATMTANPDVSGDPAVEASQEAYGILVNHTAVCTGYAEAMLLAAHAVGIPAVVVTGEATAGVTTGGHAWNRVRVDGAWRAVDVTWDDATTTDGTEVLRHDFLLLPLSDPLLSSRVEDGEWVTQGNEALYR